MATFNPMSGIPSGASASDAMGMTADQSLAMDAFDQDINFDDSLL